MLVILRENVENLGRIGDVVKVTDGYARNFLLPRKLVAEANEGNVTAFENQKRQMAKRRDAQKATSRELAARLNDQQVTLKRRVGENDRLFGSVTVGDIAESLKEAGFKIDKHWIQLDAPIKTLGVHEVTVEVEPDITASVKVWVAKEE